ncbi:MAG TPA: T9SS type A sorting domain-containing protein [Bacteroidia bacterium]|nr:T9SS type A sorting domain-containing protein [Bacteroidia bacterium]
MATTKKICAAIALIALSILAHAQSNPTPFNLNANGTYSFSSWASTSATGTYPGNMIFHLANVTFPSVSAIAQSDLLTGFTYSATSGTRIQGLGNAGILFQNKTSPINVGFTANKIGEAVLGIMTSGREQVQVSWKAQTMSTGANVTGIRCQYRIGNTGAFSDFSPASDFLSSANLSDSTTLNLTLPEALEGLPLVQLRWIYYTVNVSSSVSKAIRLDDISVTSLPSVIFSALPNACVNSSPFNLTDGSPSGGSYSGTGVVNGNMFDPSISGAGTFVITYTYTDNNNFSNSASTNLIVNNGTCVSPVGLAANSCGAVNLMKNSYIYTETVLNAQDYEYEFSGGDLASTILRRRNNWYPDFALGWISELNYGQTYDVRVRAKVGGVWGIFANTCTIGMNAVTPLPQLTASACGAINLALNSYIFIIPVTNAQDYYYQFQDISTAQTIFKNRGNGYADFNLGWAIGLKYGHSYNVRVCAKVNNTWGAYGATCQITLVAFPTTQLTVVSCGVTELALSDKIFTTPVGGATNYEYRFTPLPEGTPIVKQRNSGSNYYVLSWASLAQSTIYNVEVRARAGGDWGAFGAVCTIALSSSSRLADPLSNAVVTPAPDFSAVVHPNPIGTGTEVTPYIQINGAGGQTAVVRIYDMTGKEMIVYAMQPEGDEFAGKLIDFPQLSPGVYIISVMVNDRVQNSRLVVE